MSLEQAAELEGVEYHNLYRKIKRNKLKAVKLPSKERHGFEYRISVNDLTEKARVRYYKQQGALVDKPALPKPAEERYQDLALTDLTEEQRRQAAFWLKVIRDWQSFSLSGKKTEQTEEFIRLFNKANPEQALTERTLYHKLKLYRDYGEVALADGRSARKEQGKTTIPEIAWSVFVQWWLDEAKPSVMHVYRLTAAWAELDMPELLPLPQVDSFYREVKKIPVPVVESLREGKKALDDKVLAYVYRTYNFYSNEIWCSDYHTLDLFARCDWTGRVYRPHVVFWVDVRSRKSLSLYLTDSANADGVFIGFRKAARKYGLPRDIYVDNGREYLVHDFGGRGRRKSDEKAQYGSTILELAGVGMISAIPGNARAKILERIFKVMTEEFSKLVKTYCGSGPEKKPERLEGILKKGKEIPLASEIARDLELYVEGWFNHESSKAEGLGGMSRNECYAKNLLKKRVATEEQLNLMLLRSARLQRVKRNGVVLKFGETKLWYYNTELIQKHFNQSVLLRYDPEDLTTVRIEDEKGRFLLVAELLESGGYDGEKDKEAIKKVNRLNKEQKQFISGYKEKLEETYLAPQAKEILLRKAAKNMEEEKLQYEAKVLEPVTFANLKRAAGAGGSEDDGIVDFEKMVQIARKNKGER